MTAFDNAICECGHVASAHATSMGWWCENWLTCKCELSAVEVYAAALAESRREIRGQEVLLQSADKIADENLELRDRLRVAKERIAELEGELNEQS